MKRSEINQAIRDAIEFFEKNRFPLPKFAYFTPDDWVERFSAYNEVVDCRLGWDVTDAGSGDFLSIGRTIFTLRNGNVNLPEQYPKNFAQKIMYLQEGQRLPMHHHASQMEDIINQAGGVLQIQVWNKDKSSETLVSLDGRKLAVDSGSIISLNPGESISLVQGVNHQFWAEKGTGSVLSMEISSVCDDISDNIWQSPATRFPEIIEDEEKEFLLCLEYPDETLH